MSHLVPRNSIPGFFPYYTENYRSFVIFLNAADLEFISGAVIALRSGLLDVPGLHYQKNWFGMLNLDIKHLNVLLELKFTARGLWKNYCYYGFMAELNLYVQVWVHVQIIVLINKTKLMRSNQSWSHYLLVPFTQI